MPRPAPLNDAKNNKNLDCCLSFILKGSRELTNEERKPFFAFSQRIIGSQDPY